MINTVRKRLILSSVRSMLKTALQYKTVPVGTTATSYKDYVRKFVEPYIGNPSNPDDLKPEIHAAIRSTVEQLFADVRDQVTPNEVDRAEVKKNPLYKTIAKQAADEIYVAIRDLSKQFFDEKTSNHNEEYWNKWRRSPQALAIYPITYGYVYDLVQEQAKYAELEEAYNNQ